MDYTEHAKKLRHAAGVAENENHPDTARALLDLATALQLGAGSPLAMNPAETQSDQDAS